MKLILTQEVTGLGAPGDVVEVKDGYGRNFLIPRGFGIRWTRGGEKQITSIRRGREVREVRDQSHAADIKRELEALSVKIPVRAGGGQQAWGGAAPAAGGDSAGQGQPDPWGAPGVAAEEPPF